MKFNLKPKLFDLLWSLCALMVRCYIFVTGRTTKWAVIGDEHYFQFKNANKPVIFAFWHNQILLIPYIYTSIYGLKQVAVLISKSRDGERLGYFIQKYGYHIVRGSSSRGGAGAIIELKKRLDEGYDIAITPDGPKGPRYKVHSGIIKLSSMSGIPVIPVSYYLKRFKELKTWDHFRIPYPFNRAVLVVGEPVWIPRDLDADQLEQYAREMDTVLDDTNNKAHNLSEDSS